MRSHGAMVDGNGGSVLNRRLISRTKGRIRIAVPSGRWGAHKAHADKEHGQQHGGHQPVQEARSQGELRRGRGGAHRAASPGDTALGGLGSPSRRVKDSEYTAERALSQGSSG